MAESADHSDRYDSTDGPTADGLRIGHWNVQSLGLGTKGESKMSKVKDIILRNCFDVFVVSETMLNSKVRDATLAIPNFNLERLDRSNDGKGRGAKSAGGLVVYIHERLTYLPTEITKAEGAGHIQFISLHVTAPIIVDIVAVYNPPKPDCSHISQLSFLMQAVMSFRGNTCPIIFLGDINIDRFHLEKYKNMSVINAMNQAIAGLNLTQLINRCTRLGSQTLVDHIYTDQTDEVSESDVIRINLSDHDIIYCVVRPANLANMANMATTRRLRYQSYSGNSGRGDASRNVNNLLQQGKERALSKKSDYQFCAMFANVTI